MPAPYQPSQRAKWAAGQPISRLMSRALEDPNLISLAAGFVDNDTLPVDSTFQAIEAMFADPAVARAALQYGSTIGYPALRRMLSEQCAAMDGLAQPPPIDRIVVTAGSNQLLHLVSESILDPGDVVLCAAPTYFVYMGLLAGLGARAVGVASDDQGMIPESLEQTLAGHEAAGQLHRVKAIYLVPYFDNPAGITMPLERRRKIVEIAQSWSEKHKLHVISDEAYRQLRYWGEDIPSPLAFDPTGETVIVAGTFSKPFSPGLRVGWGILPPHLVGPVCDQKGNVDFGSPNFTQFVMAEVLRTGLFDTQVARLREGYRTKLTAMLDALDEFVRPLSDVQWMRPSGGLYVWLQVPERIDTGDGGILFETALRRGVLYVPGAHCYPHDGVPIRRNTMRLSFGVQSCQKIREGVEKLAAAISEVAE